MIRRLAENETLNLFRAFPDSETAEFAVLHLGNRRVIGLQVKTVGITRDHPRATVNVYASSFRPAPTTYFVVLAWLREEARFHEECLAFRSLELREFGIDEGDGHITFKFRPGATDEGRQDRYRRHLADLPAQVEALL